MKLRKWSGEERMVHILADHICLIEEQLSKQGIENGGDLFQYSTVLQELITSNAQIYQPIRKAIRTIIDNEINKL